MVEDEDGFQIPTPINEVVVDSQQESYSTANMVAAMKKTVRKSGVVVSDGRSMKAILNEGMEDLDIEAVVDDDPSQKEITFKKPVEERKGGNLLSAYLAFVPIDIKQVTNTQFETYLVNDSNYYLQYVYASAENSSWTVRAQGVLEPNTKEFIEEFSQREVNGLSRVYIQMIAFKKDKPYTIKQPISVQLRIDQVKFYKLHVFTPNDFFEQPSLLYPIIEDDRVARSLDITAEKMKEEMYQSGAEHDSQEEKKQARQGFETFVDWMSHKDLGQKALLFIIDGTYGSRHVNGAPAPKWQKEPFNNQWCCSLIVSQDEVACDAVGMDLIINEWPEYGSLNYCDEYLLEAATIPDTHSGSVYMQDGKALTRPLGLMEHCDKDRRYTRLELIYKLTE